jgi:4-hydroxy-tetrahydrodipicolinate synthase
MTNMTALSIHGSIPAIITPMLDDGELDLPGLRRLLDWHIAEGSDAVVIVGTTGESPTVDLDEHCMLIRAAVEHVSGRIPVIAGTGANSTSEAIELAQCARAVGATAHLSVVPYYNKPTQEGLYRHFKAIAEAVDLPLILYNVPGRTVADLSNDTAMQLAKVHGVVGIKDATGNLERATDLIRRAPPGFAVYSGDDAAGLAIALLGGHGVISVTANVAPRLMHEMLVAARAGDLTTARAINLRLFGLHKHLFCEANPIPVKWACARMGLVRDALRLPLTPLSADCHDRVLTAMHDAGIAV